MRGRISCIDATATELVVCDDSGHVSTLAAANAALIHRSVGGEAHSNIVRWCSQSVCANNVIR